MYNEKIRRGKKRIETVPEEIMAENFPNVMKNNNLHNQKAQQTPYRINTKRCTLKMMKGKIKRKSRKRNGENGSSHTSKPKVSLEIK